MQKTPHEGTGWVVVRVQGLCGGKCSTAKAEVSKITQVRRQQKHNRHEMFPKVFQSLRY